MSRQEKERYDALLGEYRALQDSVARMEKGPKLKWQDALTLVGVFLTLASFQLEDIGFVVGCLSVSAVLICASVWGHKEWGRWRYLVAFVVLVTFFYSSYRAWDRNGQQELSQLANRLVPANEPTPRNYCSERETGGNGLLVLMGFATSYVDTFPHTVVSVDDVPRLVVNRDRKGEAYISLDVFSPDSKIIASLDETGFTVRQGSFFKFQRKDKSSLRVVDEYNEEVLNVRYVNPKAIWINAVLRYPGSNSTVLHGSDGGGICTSHAGRAEINFSTKTKTP